MIWGLVALAVIIAGLPAIAGGDARDGPVRLFSMTNLVLGVVLVAAAIIALASGAGGFSAGALLAEGSPVPHASILIRTG